MPAAARRPAALGFAGVDSPVIAANEMALAWDDSV
jgi:hypothetical protein